MKLQSIHIYTCCYSEPDIKNILRWEKKMGGAPVWWLWLPLNQWSWRTSSPGWWSEPCTEARWRRPPPGPTRCVGPPAGRSSAPPPRCYGTKPHGSLPAPRTGTKQRERFFMTGIQTSHKVHQVVIFVCFWIQPQRAEVSKVHIPPIDIHVKACLVEKHHPLNLPRVRALPARVRQPEEQVFQSFQDLHKPRRDTHIAACCIFTLSTKLTVHIHNKPPGREHRVTLAQIFSGVLWLPLAFSFSFLLAFRTACKSSGFTPVCEHIIISSSSRQVKQFVKLFLAAQF